MHAVPNAKWWIKKSDGCDVIPSSEVSIMLEWNGDFDIGNGDCQVIYQECVKTTTHLLSIGVGMENRLTIISLLQKNQCDFTKDLHFLRFSLQILLISHLI